MKNPSRSQPSKKIVLLVSALGFFWACNNGDDPAPSNEKRCKLISDTFISSGPSSPGVTVNHTIANTYAYDDRGNNVSMSFSNNFDYSDGKSTRSSYTNNKQYDKNDFLIRTLTQSSNTYLDGSTSIQSNDIKYEYDNNRLSKATYTSTTDGVVTTSSLVYDYDGQGRLIKLTNATNNSYSNFEYLGEHVYKITRVDAVGNSTSPLIEFNAAGLIVKSVSTQNGETEENKYQYNSEGLMVRFETYYDGKPFSAQDMEYDNKENPNASISEEFKGHPFVPTMRPSPKDSHNVTRLKHYTGNETNGQWNLTEDTQYTYEYNSKNLPVKVTSKTLDKDGKETSSSTRTLEYQDCP